MTDILAGQGSDPAALAEIYDLEHDEIREDLVFYREWARRVRGPVIDLGCGSGRLFGALLDGGAPLVVGVDGSWALLSRARERIAHDDRLRGPAAAGRIELIQADVRRVEHRERFALAILAGVLSHLDGPEEAARALERAAGLLRRGGLLIVDGLGPGALPTRDLPLSVDWTRTLQGREVVRRSQLVRRETPEGLRVIFSTLADAVEPDGTIARLPASFRLWYPTPNGLLQLVEEAGLTVTATYGSHDLEALDGDSERCIVVAMRPARRRGGGPAAPLRPG